MTAAAPASEGVRPGDRTALRVLALGFLGFLPLVPGTFGTVGGVALALALPSDHWRIGCLGGALAASVLTVLLGRAAARAAGRKDPQAVVMDEVAGVLVTLAFLADPAPLAIAAGFLLFRACDMIKPPPARRLERLPDGWGVLLDDIAAGVWAGLLLLGANAILPLG